MKKFACFFCLMAIAGKIHAQQIECNGAEIVPRACLQVAYSEGYNAACKSVGGKVNEVGDKKFCYVIVETGPGPVIPYVFNTPSAGGLGGGIGGMSGYVLNGLGGMAPGGFGGGLGETFHYNPGILLVDP